jgi:hypothetical protein
VAIYARWLSRRYYSPSPWRGFWPVTTTGPGGAGCSIAASTTVALAGPAAGAPFRRRAASAFFSWFVMHGFIESYHVI